MKYREKWWRQAGPCLIVFMAFHLYFFFFMPGNDGYRLLYLDFLLMVPGALWTAADYRGFKKREAEKKGLLEEKTILCRTFSFYNREIAEHDVEIMEEQLDRQFQENCDLQDYVAKWCHEVKIPLAAGLLINERNRDASLKMSMREQLERINQLLGSMLLSCRIQSPLFDLQIRKTGLSQCVRASIHNNQFFLIQKGFELTVETEEVTVYTDPEWLVYILDQFLSNAVKYGRKGQQETGKEPTMPAPRLRIWSDRKEGAVRLWVEDYGEGIRDQDIGRIFEKGFTGTSYHNGTYKSTGLGLYMVSKIADRLGLEICVESRYGEGSRFGVVFLCGRRGQSPGKFHTTGSEEP